MCATIPLTLFPYGSLYIHAHIPLTESFMTPKISESRKSFSSTVCVVLTSCQIFLSSPVDNIANVRHQRNNRKGIDLEMKGGKIVTHSKLAIDIETALEGV